MRCKIFVGDGFSVPFFPFHVSRFSFHVFRFSFFVFRFSFFVFRFSLRLQFCGSKIVAFFYCGHSPTVRIVKREREGRPLPYNGTYWFATGKRTKWNCTPRKAVDGKICFLFVRSFRIDRLACTFVLAYWAMRENGQRGSEDCRLKD